MIEENPPVEYISYNGLARSPIVWGVPFMPGLFIMSFCLLGGLVIGTFIGGLGWAFALIGVPILLFLRVICANDDRAHNILLIEVKWVLLKFMGGNAKYFGGTMAMSPISYGRKSSHVKQVFKRTVRG